MPSITNLTEAQANNLKSVEYWEHRLLAMITLEKGNFVFSNLGKMVNLPRKQGTKTFSMRRYNSLPVSADLSSELLAEGVAPTPLIVEGQKVQGVINQFGAYIEETDWVDDIHFDDIKSVYQPELARHAAEVIERQIISSFSDASEYFIGGNTAVDDYAATDTDYMTLKEARKVALTMKNYRRSGHSKFGGHPVIVMHPNVMEDLLDDTDLTDKILLPGNDNTPIKNGTLQQYKAYGMYFVETLIADVTENANVAPVNVYTSYMLGKDPYVVIKLGKGGLKWKMTGFDADSGDPLGQKATFGYKLWTGSKVIDPIAITKIYSLSAYDIVADFSTDSLGDTADQTVNA